MPELASEAHAVIANNRVAREAVGRAAQPALLRGLIFTETGAAMTPHHTKRKGKRYCYYTSMDMIRKRPAVELRGPSGCRARWWRRPSSVKSAGCCVRPKSRRAPRAGLAAFIVQNAYLNGETIRIDGALRMR